MIHSYAIKKSSCYIFKCIVLKNSTNRGILPSYSRMQLIIIYRFNLSKRAQFGYTRILHELTN